MSLSIRQEYLQNTDIIDWQAPSILTLAQTLASETPSNKKVDIAKACFEWVRDEIYHSVDYQMNPVTCRASEVLKYRTGYCYAKSHLLAALLRANGIPTGFCYQRLSMDDTGAPYCLHGLNSLYLPEFGWYRVDVRGNRPDIDAQFSPPQEQLAFKLQFQAEIDFKTVLSEPLAEVIEVLQRYSTWDSVLQNLPDISGPNPRLQTNLMPQTL